MTLKENGALVFGVEAEMRSPAFSIIANTSSCFSLDWIFQTEVEAHFFVTLES